MRGTEPRTHSRFAPLLMKWLKIAAAVLVVAVVLLFALIGYLGSTRGTPTRRVLAPGDSVGPPPDR